MKKVLVLGSTGSIGTQTLDVARRNPDRLKIVGLAAGTRAGELIEQGLEFQDAILALGRNVAGDTPQPFSGSGKYDFDSDPFLTAGSSIKGRFAGYGEEAVLGLIEDTDADIVVNSLVGAQGMEASYAVLKAGRELALANKESLVVAGDILMPLALSEDEGYSTYETGGRFDPTGILRPIDSEHGAIFQCLLGEEMDEVDRLWITASGGPFRGRSAADLADVTPKEALAHPTWNMGPKITIDSSTLMNKGLEVIEAHHLFGMPYERIEVAVQPQSAVHSMVEMIDGSVKAHLGTTDMRIPIQFALSYPDRWETPVRRMDFRELGTIGFLPPDMCNFPCLSLAYDAGKAGGTMPCAMNAANELAVAAFLNGCCSYPDIPRAVDHVMQTEDVRPVESIAQLSEDDRHARERARRFLGI